MRSCRAMSSFIVLMFSGSSVAGIFEDNPPSMYIHLGPRPESSSPNPSPLRVDAWLQEVRWESCNGQAITVRVERDVELLGGFYLAVPRGNWCTVTPELLDVTLWYTDAPHHSLEILSPTMVGDTSRGIIHFESASMLHDNGVLMGDLDFNAGD